METTTNNTPIRPGDYRVSDQNGRHFTTYAEKAHAVTLSTRFGGNSKVTMILFGEEVTVA